MRLYSISILYFLLNYCIYAHDLNHAEPTTVKEPESAVFVDSRNQTSESANVQRINSKNSDDTNETDFSLKKTTHEVEPKEQLTTPSVDILLDNSFIPPSILIKTPTNEQPLADPDAITIAPITNDQSNPKIIHRDELSSISSQIDSQEQIKTTTTVQNISSSSNMQSLQNNSNSSDQNESRIPVTTSSKILHSSSSILNQKTSTSSPQVQTIENISIEGSTHQNNAIIQPSNDESKHSIESLSDSEPFDREFQLQTNHTTENEMHENDRKGQDLSEGAYIKNSTIIINNSNKIYTKRFRQICWRLPEQFETSFQLLENQLFRLIDILPKNLQTILYENSDDQESLINTIWFISICSMCIFFSLVFLFMGAKRLKGVKHDKEIRARCQELQQYNNRILLDSQTFERQNEKLSNEIDNLKVQLREQKSDEDVFELREDYKRFEEDLKASHNKQALLQKDIDYKQNLIQKYESEIYQQAELMNNLNREIHQLKHELEGERSNVVRLQSSDLSIETFEKLKETIQNLRSEIKQLKQEKFHQIDQSHEIQEHADQLDLEKNELIIRMTHFKDLYEQYDRTIKHLQDKINKNIKIELEDLKQTSSNNDSQLLSSVDSDVKKSNQHIRDLHHEINMKNDRIKELDQLLNQEKDRCKEIEAKLKIILELRERDAHLHIRQIGIADTELRRARTDSDRVRILQQQLELKQQKLDDVQKNLSNEQIKFNEDFSKLQHETHEKWMEVKRLTRELDSSKKECESLRKQITKYAKDLHSSQEKSKAQSTSPYSKYNLKHETKTSTTDHIEIFSGILEEISSQNTSPINGEQKESIGQPRNDSGGTSPTDMFTMGPAIFNLPGPPFFPVPFMPPPPPHPFMMHPRFPMPFSSPHRVQSPITNLSANGTNIHNSEVNDSLDVTPNSTGYNEGTNDPTSSLLVEDEPTEVKKSKKIPKKKTRTSATTVIKQDK